MSMDMTAGKHAFANVQFIMLSKLKTVLPRHVDISKKRPALLGLLQWHEMSSREVTSLTDIKPARIFKAHL